MGWFSEYFDAITALKRPEDIEDDVAFTDMLRIVLQDHNAVIQTMALGVLELRDLAA